MSWSVQGIGKPAALKNHLKVQFAAAKLSTEHIPQERASVEAVETAVNAQLDFLSDVAGVAVSVEASGSVYKSTGQPPTAGGASCHLNLKSMYGFVEG